MSTQTVTELRADLGRSRRHLSLVIIAIIVIIV
jgi:hypothetical protein